MAELDSVYQERVDDFMSKGNESYEKGELLDSIESLKSAWNVLPDNKFKYDDSYHIARYITELSMQIKAYDQAIEWAFIVKKCDPERPEIGEKEFLIGQVLYEAGKITEAIKFIKIASKVSNGLCFEGEDVK
jgi:tetratricopeptide (TPR) repeat protein